jgi:gliding motility-associated-like protein
MKIINRIYGITLLGRVFIFLALLSGPVLLAQNFTLSVSVTHETCPGNGALQFSVANAGASVNYKVFLLPNTTTPISNNSNTAVNGLQDGTYLVVATTTISGSPVTSQQEATINNNTTPLVFAEEWDTVPSFCNDGEITVVMESGSPLSYQITAGPETAPAQASPTFTGLPEGLYTIKATDACGTAIVSTYILGTTAPEIELQPGGLMPQLPDCDHVTLVSLVTNATFPDTSITYPLTAQVTVYPPDGSTPQVFTQEVFGAPDVGYVFQTIPLYYAQDYSYDLLITDSCGDQFSLDDVPIYGVFGVGASTVDLECNNKSMKLSPNIYVPPVTITFTSVPDGFDPEINPSYPTFFGDAVFGTNESPLLPGTYNYTATDACGRTVNGSFSHQEPEPIEPEVGAANQDCDNNLGQINGEIPSRLIETATITGAPQAFIDLYGPLPYDASGFVNGEGKILIQNLPPGDYVIEFTDDCDNTYDPINVSVPQYSASQLNPLGRPDCEPGMASVKVGGGLLSLSITVVPTNSPLTAPFDGAPYINPEDGNFSLDNLVPGTYTFQYTTECATYTETRNLIGYDPGTTDIQMIPHCGSFDISLFNTANGANIQFWLQRESPTAPGTWLHPSSGQVFAGTYTTATAVQLTNNTVNYTLIYPEGSYRVVKTWRAFESGDIATDKTCEEILYEFEYIDGVQINGVQSLTCTGVSGDIQVNALGVAPLTYTITEKNGDTSFNIANGTDNAFMGLDSASYTVEVADPCGNVDVLTFNLAEVPSLVNAYDAPNMITCDQDEDNVETFDLSQQDSYILNGQDNTNITITYHASYADADAGLSPLPTSFTTGPCTVYARAEYNGAVTCHDISLFEIILNHSGQMVMDDLYYVCDGTQLELIADPGYVGYLWSTGANTQSIFVSEAGQYKVTAINSQQCISEKTVQVFTTAMPAIAQVTVEDWTEENNTISVFVEGSQASVQNFEYSLNGIHWQESNTFTGLEAGSYTVYVRDVYGCDWVSEKVFLLTYPKFFTPNGDGINDRWRINFAAFAEPDLMVHIYDRYGKLITGFDASNLGWDGTFNNTNLPATDYWFVVKRQNGQEYKGHFSLLR